MIVEYATKDSVAERYDGEIRVTLDGDVYLVDQSQHRLVLKFHVKHPKGRHPIHPIQPFILVVLEASAWERDALRQHGIEFESARGDLFA